MGQQAIENLRQSEDSFLSLPEIITKKEILKAGMYLKPYMVNK